MTDRDPNSGQFAETGVGFGHEGVLRDAGYVPYKEESGAPEGADALPDELTEAEAAEVHAAESLAATSRTPESEIKTFSALDGLDDNVSLTIEQAAKIKADDKDADSKAAELAEAERIRSEVDELRGEKKADKAEQSPAQERPSRDPSNPEIDPEIEKALSNPRIAEAISKQIGEAESVKQRYSAAIEQADQVASAAFIAKYPELYGQPIDNWNNLIAAMSPQRAQEAIGTIQTLLQVKTALQHQQMQQAEVERTRFNAASDTFEQTIKDVPNAQRAEVESEIVTALKERNSDMAEVAKFLKAIDGSALAMKLLWELGDQRRQLKTLRNAPKAVATRNLPPVQKPGTRRDSGARSADDLASLSQRLNQSGSLDDAVKLRVAMKQR